jgi:ABC-type phosphate/phosphonate transport system substrate-binding protein
MNLARRKFWTQLGGSLVIILCASGLSAQESSSQQRLTLWSVRIQQGDNYADKALAKLIGDSTNLEVKADTAQPYGTIIQLLIDAARQRNSTYLARVPPYVFVAAEMQGADLEPLATYKSNATDAVVYHAWFIVKKSKLPQTAPTLVGEDPNLDDLIKFIANRSKQGNPVRFIYHDKFSTSSYFLPSIFFRRNNIFSVKPGDQSTEFVSILSEKPDNVTGSSDLISQVANGTADLAAVWDGTKKKYEPHPGDDLVFIPLPNTLPNDLLVCSKELGSSIKKSIKESLRSKSLQDAARSLGLRDGDLGDFRSWIPIGEAEEANKSLAELRHLAQVHPSDVTVEVLNSKNAPVDRSYLEAVKTAVRLSNTEFVPYDPDFHRHADYTWTLAAIHDGAISLTSEIEGFDVEAQTFPISFTDPEDLSKRISHLIQSRLHRIRYIWPYEDEVPTVIRDVDFPLVPGSVLKARKVIWQDLLRDAFQREATFNVVVDRSDFHSLRLAGFIPRNDRTFGFDPMSNVAYQVLLVRPSEERLIFKILTYTFVILFCLAAVAAAYDFNRKPKPQVPLALIDGELFKHSYQNILQNYYQPWCDRKIADANVLWCNRSLLEEFVTELNASGFSLTFNRVRKQTQRQGFFAKIPLLKNVLDVGFERSSESQLVFDPSRLGDSARLSDVVQFLLKNQLLSSFIGTQLEWDTLNTIASQVFQRFQATPIAASNGGNNNGGNKMVSQENPELETLVSKHFNDVINESMPKASFFNQAWELKEQNGDQQTFIHKETITYQNVSDEDSVSQMVLLFKLPKDVDLSDYLKSEKLNAWLLGRIHKRYGHTDEGLRSLCIEFKPLALVQQ